VIDALAEPLAERHRENAQRRLARLDRKLSRAVPGQLIKQLDDETPL
jgi:ribose 1,5-bisphosphokinase PhnN